MRSGLLFLASLLLTCPAWAQRHTVTLPAATQAYVVSSDPTAALNQRRTANGRIDLDTGMLRAAYRIQATSPVLATPEQTARAWMQQQQDRFGWTNTDDLVLQDEIQTSYSTHLTFQQVFRGVPVHRRTVKVNLGPDGLPTMALSDYVLHLKDAGALDTTPALSSELAREQSQQLIAPNRAFSTEPTLVIYPTNPPVLAWRTMVWIDGMPGEWEVMLNAHTAVPLHVLDQAMHRHDIDTTHKHQRVDGTGMVWIPDPITSAGIEYGGKYVDANDANVDALNDERVSVTLRDIDLGTDGKYRLRGPHVDIVGDIFIPYSPPAEDGADKFDYLRANQHFEAVQVYYHIDNNQRYIQSLNIGYGIQDQGVRANPHGYGERDNSAYYPALNALSFGDGGVDDGEDAEVIIHEYGHALLYHSAPSLSGWETKALHEGWSDYWAVSYTRGLMDDGSVPPHDWQKVFSWDGNETWAGRRLGSTATYPDGFECVQGGSCDIYADGLIWATSMMEIYDAIGKDLTDQLNLLSHSYLAGAATFVDAAQAIVQADKDRYQGAHVGEILPLLIDRGYIECTHNEISLFHTAEEVVTNRLNPLVLALQVESCLSDTQSPVLHYTINDGAWQYDAMQRNGSSTHTYALTLPQGTESLQYYFEVTTADDPTAITRLPTDAPQSVFAVDVIEDTAPPIISHRYLTHVATVHWPPDISVSLSDLTGISRAWVEFAVQESGGTLLPSQSFTLAPVETQYIGRFPAMHLKVGDRIHYRILASDDAAFPNTGQLPSQDQSPFTIHIIRPGILAAYDAEGTPALSEEGAWQRAEPSYGLTIPHSGQRAWVTTTDGPYSNQPTVSTLEIPEIDLINFSAAVLSFWHWHDFEHSGITEPVQSPSGTAYDGGNIKVSTDGGASWQILTPRKGYTATLDESNPLAGETAYAGYSYGWRRALFDLPHANRVSLRLEVATGSDNTKSSAHNFAGWAIDDVQILAATPPSDKVPPVVQERPPPRINIQAGQNAPTIYVTATDNTGIAAVLADYLLEPGSGAPRGGVLRLAMDPSSLTTFVGNFSDPSPFQRGDQLSYRFRVLDFDNNTLQTPAAGNSPFVIESLLAESVPSLTRATITGHWLLGSDGNYETVSGTGDRVSSILLVPMDLASNVKHITFKLDQTLAFENARGNVKISTDNGSVWELLSPDEGYSVTYRPGEPHPMMDELVFPSTQEGTSRFDLTEYAGKRVWIRIDLATKGNLGAGESWSIHSATLESTTVDEFFEKVLELALYSNFPEPFSARTTVNYALPEEMHVHAEVYNALGQRIQLLVDGTQVAGTHTLQLDLSGVAAGLYFLRMRAGSQTLLEPLIIAR